MHDNYTDAQFIMWAFYTFTAGTLAVTALLIAREEITRRKRRPR